MNTNKVETNVALSSLGSISESVRAIFAPRPLAFVSLIFHLLPEWLVFKTRTQRYTKSKSLPAIAIQAG